MNGLNPLTDLRFAILESPYRWQILAALSLGAASVGAIVMIAYNWPHVLARIWFYAGLALALYCAYRTVQEWRYELDQPEDPALTPPSE